MSYNFEERINRVINNHQFTCQHTSHYLFVLKGFEPLLNSISLNVQKLDLSKLSSHTNFWITYEESFNLDDGIWSSIRGENYDIWIVDFNFFINSFIALHPSNAHIHQGSDNGVLWVNYHDNDNLTSRKTLSIFNTNNPLIGVLSDSKKVVDNNERLNIIKASLNREAI